MRKVRRIRQVQRLTRILESLELELIDATDEEILEAAKDLGMDPKMKGSAAFMGLKFPMSWRAEDFFEFVRMRTEAAAATARMRELATSTATSTANAATPTTPTTGTSAERNDTSPRLFGSGIPKKGSK
jgi:hypothetical protein